MLATPCQVSGVPSTALYDEDGMPDLTSAPPALPHRPWLFCTAHPTAPQSAPPAPPDYVPPHPRTQNRKKLTLATRAKQKVEEKVEKSNTAALESRQQKQQSETVGKKREMSTPTKRDKPEAPDRPSASKARKAQPPPAKAVLFDLELTRPIVCATSEAAPRCELCAFVSYKSFAKRVHVSTLTFISYGPMYVEHTKALAQLIEQGGFTKTMILEKRKVMALSR